MGENNYPLGESLLGFCSLSSLTCTHIHTYVFSYPKKKRCFYAQFATEPGAGDCSPMSGAALRGSRSDSRYMNSQDGEILGWSVQIAGRHTPSLLSLSYHVQEMALKKSVLVWDTHGYFVLLSPSLRLKRRHHSWRLKRLWHSFRRLFIPVF